MSKLIIPLLYHNILFATFKWDVFEFFINLLNLLWRIFSESPYVHEINFFYYANSFSSKV